jgi:hypothetical protein
VNVEKRKIQYFRWSTHLWRYVVFQLECSFETLFTWPPGWRSWIQPATNSRYYLSGVQDLELENSRYYLSWILGSRAWERQTCPSHVSNIQPHMYNTTTKSDLEKDCQYQGNKYLASTFQQSSLHILLAIIHYRVHTKCPILFKLFKAQFYTWKKP